MPYIKPIVPISKKAIRPPVKLRPKTLVNRPIDKSMAAILDLFSFGNANNLWDIPFIENTAIPAPTIGIDKVKTIKLSLSEANIIPHPAKNIPTLHIQIFFNFLLRNGSSIAAAKSEPTATDDSATHMKKKLQKTYLLLTKVLKP